MDSYQPKYRVPLCGIDGTQIRTATTIFVSFLVTFTITSIQAKTLAIGGPHGQNGIQLTSQLSTNNPATSWIPIQQHQIDSRQRSQQQITTNSIKELHLNHPIAGKASESKKIEVLLTTQVANASRDAKSQFDCNKRRPIDISNPTSVSVASERKLDYIRMGKKQDGEIDRDDDQDDELEEPQQQYDTFIKPAKKNTTDAIEGSDSVSFESSLIPPGSMRENYYNLPDSSNQRRYHSSNGDNDNDPAEDDDHNHSGPMTARASNLRRNHDYKPNRYNENEDDDNDSATNPASRNNESADNASAASDEEEAARREQEAAEASEAGAADKSALDEQKQIQREIILAQAQSEAKAIKEQQEALLRQQQSQQQILLRRHQSDLSHHDELRARGGRKKKSQSKEINTGNSAAELNYPGKYSDSRLSYQRDRPRPHRQPSRKNLDSYPLQKKRQQYDALDSNLNRRQDIASNFKSTMRGPQQLDIEFSDQSDVGINNDGSSKRGLDEAFRKNVGKNSASSRDNSRGQDFSASSDTTDNELAGEYSISRTQHVSAPVASIAPAKNPRPQPIGLQPNLVRNDLMVAAQHYYGTNYGSLEGHLGAEQAPHHGNFYQFAESKKKGQFDSGFKRGGKKFYTSGHSSIHGGHAQGHVEWSSKKLKGSHYWDLKHKNKKHYGGGHDGHGGYGDYGGGHSYH